MNDILIPFLKPNLVPKEKYLLYLEQIDQSHIYSNFGPLNRQFEQRVLGDLFEDDGAVATVCNATTGLMVAISLVRRPKGRYALMPSFTFSATPLAACWCGLEPYFLDISPEDWTLDNELLQAALRRLGDQVAVVVPYATFGTAIDLTLYEELHRTGVPVVLDAAPSLGTIWEKEQFGKGFPGVVVFSFHATKAFGIGEGGLVYSGDISLIERLRKATNFGFSENRETTILGLNGKLSEYGAAVALGTLEAFSAKRKQRLDIYRQYVDAFGSYGLLQKGWVVQQVRGEIPHQFFPVLCPETDFNAEVVNRMEKLGIQLRTYFSPPCHQQSLFKEFPRMNMEVTGQLAQRVLSLPLWEGMENHEIEMVVGGLVG